MDSTALLWVLGIIVTALIGVAVGLFVHVKEDAKFHERMATLEERTSEHGKEIRSLRDRWHDLKEEVRRMLVEAFRRG